MKILHTADWHVGKVLKNQPRFDEHRAVLADLVRIADAEDVDLVVVAGDLFETSSPNPQAQGLVMKTLLRLRADGRHVVVLAGNHDNQRLVDEVYRTVLGEVGIHVVGLPKPATRGGTLRLPMRDGTTAQVAVLPFLAYRYAVRAAEIVLSETSDHSRAYANQVGVILDSLTSTFADDTVNIVTTHATLLGGRWGGGERQAQTLLGYELPANLFPAGAHYAALGHLHRYQEIDGPCPIAYSGSPLALDFGEEANDPVALVVHANPGTRARVRPVPVRGGRPLRTLRGSFEQVVDEGRRCADEPFFRVILAQQASAGLADRIRDALPGVLEVQIDEAFRPRATGQVRTGPSRLGKSPTELFADFLTESQVDDARVGNLFAELLDEVTGGHG
ncbi:MAG TPA: exonuclease SbcCD subunit D [Pseudonocardiaceae bacterium]|jgi:exonuclease SbcD|nr:exonuclease SbcCD subunit D [Pseudonocardiaceae bacterium]